MESKEKKTGKIKEEEKKKSNQKGINGKKWKANKKK